MCIYVYFRISSNQIMRLLIEKSMFQSLSYSYEIYLKLLFSRVYLNRPIYMSNSQKSKIIQLTAKYFKHGFFNVTVGHIDIMSSHEWMNIII